VSDGFSLTVTENVTRLLLCNNKVDHVYWGIGNDFHRLNEAITKVSTVEQNSETMVICLNLPDTPTERNIKMIEFLRSLVLLHTLSDASASPPPVISVIVDSADMRQAQSKPTDLETKRQLAAKLMDSIAEFDKCVADAIRSDQFPAAEKKSNVLVVGAGGREHAIAHKLRDSARVDTVFVAPGNFGTGRMEGERVRNIDIGADQTEELVRFAQTHNVSLVIVGPEQPLADD